MILVIAILSLLLGSYPAVAQKGGPNKPAAPTGLTATSSAIREITLSWNTVSGATSYRVYRGLTSDKRLPLIATRTVANYVDTNVTAGTTYQYAVTAVNSAGESAAAYVRGYALNGLPTGANPAIVFDYSGIWVMDSNAANATRLTIVGSYPAWSPDGMKIAFVNGTGLYVMNRDGTGMTLIANNAGGNFAPAWSPVPAPDGRYKIAYSDYYNYDLWVVNPDGTGNRQLTLTSNESDTGWNEGACTWSPDATRLVVECYRNLTVTPYSTDSLKLITVGYDGAGIAETGRTSLIEDATGMWLIASVDWCRTGNPQLGRTDRIAFDVMDTNIWQDKIYTMDVANPASLALLLPGSLLDQVNPSWSPDDSQLVFSDYSKLYAVSANGGTPAFIRYGTNPAWRRTP